MKLKVPPQTRRILAIVGLGALLSGAGIWRLMKRSGSKSGSEPGSSSGTVEMIVFVLAILVAIALTWLLVSFLVKRVQRRKQRQFDSDMVAREGIDDRKREWAAWTKELEEKGIDRYGLPFYLLLGEPQSGKSVLLQNSDLHFPFGQSKLSGVGGTRGCDWWFTEEAVVLDLAGRLFTHEGGDADAAEWKAFLELLSSYRPMCPANGIMLVIPCDSLLSDPPDEIARKANRIRETLLSLTDELEAKLPIYVILTKADKIFGFAETVHRLEIEQRHQMFGWSRSGESFERAYNPAELREAFTELVDRAQLLRDTTMATERLPEALPQVDRMYAFPEELRALYPALDQYLERIFSEATILDQLFFRGLYLTSGLQAGAPIAKVCVELLGELGDADRQKLEGLYQKQRAYFIKDLVRRRVFSEKGLVLPSSQRLKRARRNARWAYGTAATAAGLALLFGALSIKAQGSNDRFGFTKRARLIAEAPPEDPGKVVKVLAEIQERQSDLKGMTEGHMREPLETAYAALYDVSLRDAVLHVVASRIQDSFTNVDEAGVPTTWTHEEFRKLAADAVLANESLGDISDSQATELWAAVATTPIPEEADEEADDQARPLLDARDHRRNLITFEGRPESPAFREAGAKLLPYWSAALDDGPLRPSGPLGRIIALLKLEDQRSELLASKACTMQSFLDDTVGPLVSYYLRSENPIPADDELAKDAFGIQEARFRAIFTEPRPEPPLLAFDRLQTQWSAYNATSQDRFVDSAEFERARDKDFLPKDPSEEVRLLDGDQLDEGRAFQTDVAKHIFHQKLECQLTTFEKLAGEELSQEKIGALLSDLMEAQNCFSPSHDAGTADPTGTWQWPASDADSLALILIKKIQPTIATSSDFKKEHADLALLEDVASVEAWSKCKTFVDGEISKYAKSARALLRTASDKDVAWLKSVSTYLTAHDEFFKNDFSAVETELKTEIRTAFEELMKEHLSSIETEIRSLAAIESRDTFPQAIKDKFDRTFGSEGTSLAKKLNALIDHPTAKLIVSSKESREVKLVELVGQITEFETALGSIVDVEVAAKYESAVWAKYGVTKEADIPDIVHRWRDSIAAEDTPTVGLLRQFHIAFTANADRQLEEHLEKSFLHEFRRLTDGNGGVKHLLDLNASRAIEASNAFDPETPDGLLEFFGPEGTFERFITEDCEITADLDFRAELTQKKLGWRDHDFIQNVHEIVRTGKVKVTFQDKKDWRGVEELLCWFAPKPQKISLGSPNLGDEVRVKTWHFDSDDAFWFRTIGLPGQTSEERRASGSFGVLLFAWHYGDAVLDDSGRVTGHWTFRKTLADCPFELTFDPAIPELPFH